MHFLSSPAWSMKGRSIAKRTFDSPGPGAYSLHQDTESPSFMIGKSRRYDFTTEGREVPGPGSYDVSSIPRPQTAKIGKSKRDSSKQLNSPGPGTYEIQGGQTTRGVSISKRFITKKAEAVPGPGAYDIEFKDSNNACSFGKAKRSNLTSGARVPGPGSYRLSGETAGGTKIGKSKRPPLNTPSDAPGPGAYMHDDSSYSYAWTLQGRYKHKNSFNVPGPGNYDIESEQKASGCKFGLGQRTKRAEENTPGPGAYVIQSTIANLPFYATRSMQNLKANLR